MKAAKGGLRGKIARQLLILLHSCDVSEGAVIEGLPVLPHPIGIVIGQGARIGRDVTIYQHVTVGSNRHGEYPRIGAGATLYPSSILVGDILVGEKAIIGAGALVFIDVPPAAVVRGKASIVAQ